MLERDTTISNVEDSNETVVISIESGIDTICPSLISAPDQSALPSTDSVNLVTINSNTDVNLVTLDISSHLYIEPTDSSIPVLPISELTIDPAYQIPTMTHSRMQSDIEKNGKRSMSPQVSRVGEDTTKSMRYSDHDDEKDTLDKS